MEYNSVVFKSDPIDKNKLEALNLLFNENLSNSGIDAITGMSGGRDSIYQAFLLTKVLDKKVLSFTWANDFLTEDAKNAILKSGRVFKTMQMHSFSLSQDVYSMYFKSMHTVFKRFCFCAQTTIIKAIPFAFNYGIPFICVGYSPDQLSGKHGYSFGTREERIYRIKEYVTDYRKMVLYAVEKTEPSMVNRVDFELFYPALRVLENIDFYEVIPGLLMLAEYMPWNYKTVEKVVYDVYGLKSEGKNCLHSNCIYEPVRGYVEAIMDRPFLQNEAKYIINNGGFNDVDALLALERINLMKKEPKIFDQFLNMIQIEKDDFYKELYTPMHDTAVEMLLDFLSSMTKLQGYIIEHPINIVK